MINLCREIRWKSKLSESGVKTGFCAWHGLSQHPALILEKHSDWNVGWIPGAPSADCWVPVLSLVVESSEVNENCFEGKYIENGGSCQFLQCSWFKIRAVVQINAVCVCLCVCKNISSYRLTFPCRLSWLMWTFNMCLPV